MYERAISKLGGAFKLTVLLQKRVREVIRGASPLVAVTPDMSPIDIALKEILEDQIGLGEDAILGGELESEEKKAKARPKKKKKGAENGD